MPSFKPKSNKKIRVCKKYTTTLDGKHKEFVNEFDKNEFDTIPKLKQEKADLTLKIKTLDKTANIDQIMDMKDRVNEISELIKELKNKKTNYFLDNSKFIFEYFENKKNITNIDSTTNSNTNNNNNNNNTGSNKSTTSKNQMLFNFFKIQKIYEKKYLKNFYKDKYFYKL
jgi:hypothetical protein